MGEKGSRKTRGKDNKPEPDKGHLIHVREKTVGGLAAFSNTQKGKSGKKKRKLKRRTFGLEQKTIEGRL